MKNFLLGAVCEALLAVLGTAAYLKLGLAEVRWDIAPSHWETRLITSAVHASVRREASPNTMLCDPENLRFTVLCSCSIKLWDGWKERIAVVFVTVWIAMAA